MEGVKKFKYKGNYQIPYNNLKKEGSSDMAKLFRFINMRNYEELYRDLAQALIQDST